MRLRALVGAAGLLWPASVLSQIGPSSFVSGHDLYEECTNPTGSAKHIHCAGYVTGIADLLNLEGSVCLRASVTVQQIEDVIVSYLREEPRYRQISASALAGVASLQIIFTAIRRASSRPFGAALTLFARAGSN